MAYLGEFAALGAAVCWSLASIPFTAVASRIGAPATNTFKTVLGTVVLVPLALAIFGPAACASGTAETYLLLAASGVVGLSLADTALFHAYVEIGPRRSFLIFSTSPFITAALGRVFLGEALGRWALLGMATTVGGIMLVTLDKRGSAVVKGSLARGVAAAFAAAVCMAVAGVTAKAALRTGSIETFPAHAFRMAAGAVGLLVMGVASRRLGTWIARLPTAGVRPRLALGTALGPICGVWAFMLGIDHTPQTGVAMTLSSLSPILVIPLTWAFHGDRPNRRALLGAAIAVLGVALLFGLIEH